MRLDNKGTLGSKRDCIAHLNGAFPRCVARTRALEGCLLLRGHYDAALVNQTPESGREVRHA